MIRPGIEARAGQTGDFVALGVSALGLRTHHLDMIGTDPAGDLVRALHRDRGIAFTEVPRPGGTKRAVNLVSPDGRRLSLYDDTRSREADRLPPETVGALATESRHAHVSIIYPCALALPVLRESGVTISTDLHNWDGSNAYHEPFAYGADIVFVSTTALADPERTMRRIVERGRATTVVAAAGSEGAYLLADGRLTHIEAVTPSAAVVDSNGAGDAFASGFLFGLLAGESPKRCGLYGAVAGAYACTVPATRSDCIGRAEPLTQVDELTKGPRQIPGIAATAGDPAQGPHHPKAGRSENWMPERCRATKPGNASRLLTAPWTHPSVPLLRQRLPENLGPTALPAAGAQRLRSMTGAGDARRLTDSPSADEGYGTPAVPGRPARCAIKGADHRLTPKTIRGRFRSL